MKIEEAKEADFQELRRFYNRMCEVLGQESFLPNGDKGGFPSDDMIWDAIRHTEQFLGRVDGGIAAAYIMNHDCDAAYAQGHWKADAAPDQVVTLHALRVLPEYSGRGYAKEMVSHAIHKAEERGMRAIRLDCIVGNDIPQKMYQSFGFKYAGTVPITYTDIGEPRDFNLYELVLNKVGFLI